LQTGTVLHFGWGQTLSYLVKSKLKSVQWVLLISIWLNMTLHLDHIIFIVIVFLVHSVIVIISIVTDWFIIMVIQLDCCRSKKFLNFNWCSWHVLDLPSSHLHLFSVYNVNRILLDSDLISFKFLISPVGWYLIVLVIFFWFFFFPAAYVGPDLV